MLRVNVLCGPTASGKSPVGLHLAEKMTARRKTDDHSSKPGTGGARSQTLPSPQQPGRPIRQATL